MKTECVDARYEIQTRQHGGDWAVSPATRPVGDEGYARDWARALSERMRGKQSFRVVRFPDGAVLYEMNASLV